MYKLHSHPISPFAARVRIALDHKGIAWEDLGIPDPASPDHGLKTEAYLAVNPVGKIPVLVLEDGTPIAESETILDYLEAMHPEPALQPADPLARTRMRNAIRVLETYCTPSLFRLFVQLDPASRDQTIFDAEFARMADGLKLLERFVDDAPCAANGSFSLADCALFPLLHLIRGVARYRGSDEDFLAATPGLVGYYDKARAAHPLLAAEEAGMDEAAKSYGA